MNYYPFDSTKKIYKPHFGAIKAGEALLLRVLLHFDAHVHNVYLVINEDGKQPFEVEMKPEETLESYRFYDCKVFLNTGLYWYKFRYTSDFGEFYVTKTDTSLGIVSNEGSAWQQTVYDPDFSVPEHLKGGIIYQIFPDRFYNSGKPKADVPDDRFLCDDWEKQPEYRQNNGECSLGNDYYGGDLKGIAEKLPYLSELGVSIIYLNPIFEAHSNHRYNTADYMKIDP
ncbi:MAG: glycoside hydrolase family 13 protein, partial [Clostridia bacterium]|nr:glycoside hydrolase family 13 protein [Clostridia bacterium]